MILAKRIMDMSTQFSQYRKFVGSCYIKNLKLTEGSVQLVNEGLLITRYYNMRVPSKLLRIQNYEVGFQAKFWGNFKFTE